MLRQTFPTSVSHVDLAGAGQEIVRPAPAPASGPRSRSPRVLEDPERFERHVTYVVVCVLYALGLSFMDIYFSQACKRAPRSRALSLSLRVSLTRCVRSKLKYLDAVNVLRGTDDRQYIDSARRRR